MARAAFSGDLKESTEITAMICTIMEIINAKVELRNKCKTEMKITSQLVVAREVITTLFSRGSDH